MYPLIPVIAMYFALGFAAAPLALRSEHGKVLWVILFPIQAMICSIPEWLNQPVKHASKNPAVILLDLIILFIVALIVVSCSTDMLTKFR